MKLSDYVIDFLVQQKIRHIFELVGGTITHLLDSTYGRKDIQCVSVHHEQAAAFAAEGYARMNGSLGVAMATSGPGALNLLTGIGSCYFDSVPCLFITGQVNTYEFKFDRPVRQLGFQETDIVSVVRPLTKYAECVVDCRMIRYQLEKAIYTARIGRPGPVLLDIPMNIQRAEIEPNELPSYFESDEYRNLPVTDPIDVGQVGAAVALIASAQRPIILAGGGVRTAGAVDWLCKFVKQTGIPVVTSLMGLDVIPHDNPLYLGMIGAYGNRYSNLALANSDCVLVLGSRLDTRQTGTCPETFARAASKIHVDIDPNELNAKVHADVAIRGDLNEFLQLINSMLPPGGMGDISSWRTTVEGYRRSYPSFSRDESSSVIDPNRFVELVARCSAEGDIVCLDVGQNQMWAGQSFCLKSGQRLLTSGGMGSMGFALPVAIGAVMATDRRAIVICGDGGIQINIQDLDTVVSRRLPIKIFIMNNGCLGMVKQFQDMYFGGRQQSTVKGYSCPDLGRIAEAYGLKSFVIDDMQQAAGVIERALAFEGPAFVNVMLDRDVQVSPKLVVNKPIEDMSPYLERDEMRRIMLVEMLPENQA